MSFTEQNRDKLRVCLFGTKSGNYRLCPRDRQSILLRNIYLSAKAADKYITSSNNRAERKERKMLITHQQFNKLCKVNYVIEKYLELLNFMRSLSKDEFELLIKSLGMTWEETEKKQ